VWLRANQVKALGGFVASYRYVFDWELQFRYLERWPDVAYVDRVLAHFRVHDASKTGSEYPKFWQEERLARDRLIDTTTDSKVRDALVRFTSYRDWCTRVDELLRQGATSRTRAISRLCAEAIQDPVHRIDRYSLGALRRMVFRRKCPATLEAVKSG
jgi:hypothetical protein